MKKEENLISDEQTHIRNAAQAFLPCAAGLPLRTSARPRKRRVNSFTRQADGNGVIFNDFRLGNFFENLF